MWRWTSCSVGGQLRISGPILIALRNIAVLIQPMKFNREGWFCKNGQGTWMQVHAISVLFGWWHWKITKEICTDTFSLIRWSKPNYARLESGGECNGGVSADGHFLSKNDRFLRHRRHEEVVSADGRFLSKHDRFFRHRRHKVWMTYSWDKIDLLLRWKWKAV